MSALNVSYDDVILGLNITVNETAELILRTGADPFYTAFKEQLRFWVQRVLVPITVIVGVLGNTVTIVVLSRRRMRSSTNLYLTALATSDLLYLIFSFTLSLVHYPNTKTYTYSEYYGYGHMLADACSNMSVWLTVSFTMERYIAVCHPIRGKVLCTESRAKVVTTCVFLFCFLCTVPTPFEYQVYEKWDPAQNRTVYSSGPSELGEDQTYRNVFYWFTTLLFILVPLTLIAIFNSFLIHAVHQSKQARRKMTLVRSGDHQEPHTSQETKITIMLIAVVILFMLCQVPTSIVLIYSANNDPSYDSNEMALLIGLNNICNLLMAINASCNFLLYCAFSDKYRKTFLLTFLPCWYKPPSPIHSQSVCYKTTTDGLSRSPSCRSPSMRSLSRYGSSRSSARAPHSRSGSVRAANKSNYLTVPNGEGPNSPTQQWEPKAARKRVMMCFRLPKGPLRILGASKKSGDEQKTQSVPLTGQTDHTIVISSSDPSGSLEKLTSL